LRATVIAFISTCVLASAAYGQDRSNTDGFRLGVHLNGSAIRVEDSDDVESGGGIGLAIGYGFTPSLMIYLAADAASIDAFQDDPDYTLAHGDLGLRLSFANAARAFIPFVQAAATARVVTYDEIGFAGEDLEMSGMGGSVGAGVGFFAARTLSLEAGLHLTFGKFTDSKYGGIEESLDGGGFNATSTRFNLGASWYPGK
jgi:hypothetical protein